MDINYIINKIKDTDNIQTIEKAYEFAKKYIKDKKRLNGDLVMNHCLYVTDILIDLNVDITTLICGMIHEVMDNGDSDGQDIKETFGEEVYKIVSNVSKINKLELMDDTENSALYLRKVMVALSEDVRVLFIKLADRLHNMRSLEAFSKEYKKRLCNETLNVLVPIAHRLGINSIKSELENLCLYYLKPTIYNDILEKLNNSKEELQEYLNIMMDNISSIIKENEINFEMKGRVKSVYSIYNKLNNGKKWENIYDILALRIFVENESDCYTVVGLIHSKYTPVDGRFKDYIAVPKENMYQSLHTTIIGEGGRYYEVQVRTYEMDEIAEKGIASHWSYKEKGAKKIQTMMEQKLEIYRSIIESNQNIDDNEFIQVANDNILTDLIYVYTPKGDVVELPKGSTPIDFAYRIHSQVGDTMVGSFINDKLMPITTVLKDNDVVRIMTSITSKPSKEWLKHVKTTQAKNKIKSYFSKLDRDEYILKGKNSIEKGIRKRKLSINEVLDENNIYKVCNELKLRDVNEIYLNVGSLRYTPNYIINYLIGVDNNEDVLVNKHRTSSRSSHNNDILVDGKKAILIHLAHCCNPVKDDDIVGIITKYDGIAIHRKNCPNINHEQEKIVEVSWDKNIHNTFTAKIILKTKSIINKIDDIIMVLSNENINIDSIDNDSSGLYKITLRVASINELNRVIHKLENIRYVKEVKRV